MRETEPRWGMPMTAHESSLGVWWPLAADVVLANGLQLLVVEDVRAPKVVCQLHIHGAGGYYDPPDASGLAMLTVAAARHSVAMNLDEEPRAARQQLGLDVRVKAPCDGTVATFECTAPGEHLSIVIGAIAELVQRPLIAESEAREELCRVRAFRERQLAVPHCLADELLARQMAGRHPASRVRIPLSTFASCTCEQLAAFARERFVPNQARLVVMGDVAVEDVRALVVSAFGNWPKVDIIVPPVEQVPPPRRAAHVVAATGSAHLRLATFVGRRAERETDAVELMCMVLDGGEGHGRFNNATRAGMPQARLSCGIEAHKFGGTFGIHGNVTEDEVDMCIPGLVDELSRLRLEDVESGELETAHTRLIQQYCDALKIPRNRAGAYVFAHENGLGPEYWSRLPERIMSITAPEIRDVAQKYLHPDRLVAAAVGPRDPLVRVFRALDFPVTVWHQDGFELRREEDDMTSRRDESS